DEIIQIVQEYLSDDKIRPLTDYVQVLSPEKINFDILANVILYLDADEETVLTSISEKLEEYKLTLSSALGKDVIQTQIITIINSVYGVFKVELESLEDIEISEFQWANLENYSITVGGYADE
ncbi:MAG: baseplate J/gp47 family protein, partial [Candidatus Gastranaerophilales bacterium]|nr:baseplate J/gp47 family protein [Candidatus Gastranaerophilales bacterium]